MKPTQNTHESITVYLQGVALKSSNTIYSGLMKVYGVSYTTVMHRRGCMGRTRFTRRSERSKEQIHYMDQRRENSSIHGVEARRRRKESRRFQRHLKLGTYRGIRFRQGRPVRGQRTRSNARTAKRLNAQRR